MNLGIKNTIKGRFNVKKCERARTAEVRRSAFYHKDNEFDGSFSAYSRLSDEDRGLIDSVVAKDITDNPEAWADSPVLELAESGFQDNLVLNRGLDWCCNSSSSSTISFGRFAEYHVLGTGTAAPTATDTILQTETSGRRSGTYLTGSGNCGRTDVGNVITFRRTYDHGVEVGSVNYTEHGVSTFSGYGNPVNTRALITGGTLSLVAGQQARCVYDVIVTATPGAATNLTVGGSGWPVPPATDCNGQYIIGPVVYALGDIDLSGGTSAYGNALFIGTTSVGALAVSALSAITLPSFGSSAAETVIANSGITYARESYTNGTFSFTCKPTSYASATAWSSTSVAGWKVAMAGGALYFKYNQDQTKANTHRLRYPSITVTWST